MKDNIKIGSNRSFGLVFFIVFLFIGLWPILNENEPRVWSIIISFIFLILGVFKSKFLTPLNKIWFKFGMLLGKFIAPVVMGFIFFFRGNTNGNNYEIIKKRLDQFKKNNDKTYWIKKKIVYQIWKISFKMEFIKEFCQFLKIRKKYWLLPIIIFLVIFGGLIVLTQGSAIAPFIYTIF